MSTSRTPQEWRDLVDQLTLLRDNPSVDREKRQKADEILTSIKANPDARDALRQPRRLGEGPSGWDEII